MPRSSSPSFVHEVPLRVTPHDARELDVRFLCGQKVYNDTMGEGLKRLEKMKAAPEWAAAKAMPKTHRKTTQGATRPVMKNHMIECRAAAGVGDVERHGVGAGPCPLREAAGHSIGLWLRPAFRR